MKTKDKTILYLIFIVLFFAFLYAIKSILVPFIAAIIISYFLDPLADRLEKAGLSRTSSTSLILGGFLMIATLLLIVILPILYSQTLSLFNAVPNYIHTLVTEIYPKTQTFATSHGFAIDIHSYLTGENLATMFGFSGTILQNIMASGIAIINVLSLIFITPVLVFYILRDWDLLVNKINHYLPKNHGVVIRKIFKEIDQILSGYVHGQFNVCAILGGFYAVALTFLGLEFGFLIGFITGFLSFIPYIGLLSGTMIAVIVGFF